MTLNRPGMHTSFVGKVHLMPKRYGPEAAGKAIRRVRDKVGDYTSEYDAIRATASRLGMNPETLRKRIRQDEIDHHGDDTTTGGDHVEPGTGTGQLIAWRTMPKLTCLRPERG